MITSVLYYHWRFLSSAGSQNLLKRAQVRWLVDQSVDMQVMTQAVVAHIALGVDANAAE